MVIESGERCDSALDLPTTDPFTVIGQGTVITGSVSITLQPLQFGSTAIFVEVGSDDKRGGSGPASAASLVSSVSVFLPSSTDRVRTHLVTPLLGALLDARREKGRCSRFWEEAVRRRGFLACGLSGRFATSHDRVRSSTMSKADVLPLSCGDGRRSGLAQCYGRCCRR